MQAFHDISDRFRTLDEGLVYVDGPLEGHLAALDDGEVFAFRCTEIVAHALWHWVLLPVSDLPVRRSVAETFELAATSPPIRWVSIVEDRRSAAAKLWMVELNGTVVAPPL